MAQDKGKQVNYNCDSHNVNYPNGVRDSRRINNYSGANRSAGVNDSNIINNPGRVSDSGGANYSNGVSDSGGANNPGGISDPEVTNNFRIISDLVDGNDHDFNMMNNGSALQRPQHYVRQGLVGSQLTRLYLETGDSLQYGPLDYVDDFPPGSAFGEQAVEGDAALAELAVSQGRLDVDNIDLGYPEGFIEGDGASVPVPIPSVYRGQAYRRNSGHSAGFGDANNSWYRGRQRRRRLQGRGYWIQGRLQQQNHHYRDRGEYQEGVRRAEMVTNSLESARRNVAEDLEIIAGFGNMNEVGRARSSVNAGRFAYDPTVTSLSHVEGRFNPASVLAPTHTTDMAYTTAPTGHAQPQRHVPAVNFHMANGQNSGPGFRNGEYHGPSGHAFRYVEGFEGMPNAEIRNASYQTSVFDEDVSQPMPEYLRRQLQRQLQGRSSQDVSALRSAGGPSARFGGSSQQPATGGRPFNPPVHTNISDGRQLPVQWYLGFHSSPPQPSSEMRNNVYINGGHINQEPVFNQPQSYRNVFGFQYLREHIAHEESRIRMERLLAEHRGPVAPSAPRASIANLAAAQHQRGSTRGGLTAENLELVDQQLAEHQARLNAGHVSDRYQLPGPYSDRSDEEYYYPPHW